MLLVRLAKVELMLASNGETVTVTRLLSVQSPLHTFFQ